MVYKSSSIGATSGSSGGGGLSSFTSPNSTINVGGTLTAPTVDINLAQANSWTSGQTINLNGLNATIIDSLILSNNTAASLGTQQYSPSLHFHGSGWATTPANSQSADMRAFLQTIQGVTSPTSALTLQSSISGGAYSNVFSVSSGGVSSFNRPGITSTTIDSGNGTGGCTISTNLAGSGLILSGGSSTFGYIVNFTDVAASGQSRFRIASTTTQGVSGMQYCWNSSATDIVGGSADTGIKRVVASVIAPTNASTGAGWLQNTAGRARITTPVTNATNTMSNLTDLTITLIAGRKYFGRMVLFAQNSTAAEGLQFDFNGGAATMTSFEAGIAGTPIGATLGVTNSTLLSTALTATTATTGDDVYTIEFTLVVNAGGTFIPRFAEASAHVAGTAQVSNGYLLIEDSPN